MKYLLLLGCFIGTSHLTFSQSPSGSLQNEASTVYPGGMKAFYEFVETNLRYPREARKEGVIGKVLVEFTVDANGNIQPGSVRVLKRLHPACDEEASRVVRNSSPWIPGKRDGEPVAQRMAVAIEFAR